VSLRTDIHVAFDEVAPSTHGMSERIVASVLSDRSRPRAGFPWSTRLRGVTSMVAVVLLLVMAVGVLAGGRLYRDWSSFVNRPGQSSVPAGLEARPLHLPVLSAGQACPAGPSMIIPGFGDGTVEGFGDGPVIGQRGPVAHSAWGTYVYQWVITDRSLSGVVLGRGRDLVTGEAVTFVGDYAAGPVTGADTLDGLAVEQHHEALLDTSRPPQNDNPPEVYFAGSDRYVAWPMKIGLSTGASWCVAFQFDGPGFSEVFVIPSLNTGPPLN
jgi:hypothetical protein